ncbi:MAG: hypothetical protein F6K24_35110 [Okeania sp. SIO2D1]|nr:hypothetical protein [Okeania sp. SIO2D1]
MVAIPDPLLRRLDKSSALLNSLYDINLNYLGVNPPLTPPRRVTQEERVRREERRSKQE